MSSSSAFVEFARAVREADVSFLLTSRGLPEWSVHNRSCGGVVIQRGRCGAGMVADGVMAQPDAVVFVMQSSLDRHAVMLNGVPVARHGIAVLPPGSHFVFANAVPHSWISLTLPLAMLTPAQVDCLAGRSGGAAASLFETKPEAFAGLLARIDRAEGEAARAEVPSGDSPAVAEQMHDAATAISRTLVAVIGAPESRHRLAAPHHHMIVRRAFEETRDDNGPAPGLADLCAAAGVCERTLRRAFGAVYGMPPSRYLKVRQLNRVHAALLDPSARGRMVTDVLTSHGVTELGRFAAHYRTLFGELPSHTMRRLERAAE
ncbi:AraC family transcriptional regulator [Rhodoplanes azumiensis]|uniref:Helix-turn-helix domain-containing protein n=1 Tax=Rhodoplanes azumiensis TaxID=1897628 RepID=A0ABW5AHT7_9BRAD